MIVKINARFLYRQEVVPKNHLSILLTLKYNANLIYRLGQPSNLRWDSNFRKIYVFEERGDEFYREEIRRLFTEKQSAAYMIYWKDILVDMERMLDAAAGAATLLQKLFVRV